jgi:hypothetical protein
MYSHIFTHRQDGDFHFLSSIAPEIVETDRSRESGRCVWGAFTGLWVTARAAAGLLPTDRTMKVLSLDVPPPPKLRFFRRKAPAPYSPVL